jgi:DNA-binding transcriptional MerR regulator
MLAIGTVARRTGIKIPTIRFYEQERLIEAPAAHRERATALFGSCRAPA